MSYTPTEWHSGDIVTSEKMNKLEQGVAAAGGGGGVFYVTKVIAGDEDPIILNKTWKEIRDAAQSSLVICKRTYEDEDSCDFAYLAGYKEGGNGDPYIIYFAYDETYFSETENGYPTEESYN